MEHEAGSHIWTFTSEKVLLHDCCPGVLPRRNLRPEFDNMTSVKCAMDWPFGQRMQDVFCGFPSCQHVLMSSEFAILGLQDTLCVCVCVSMGGITVLTRYARSIRLDPSRSLWSVASDPMPVLCIQVRTCVCVCV